MVKKIRTVFILFDMIHEREKIAVFTYRSPYFCFSWRHPWGNHAKCCMDGENSILTNCLAACTHLSSTVSQLFELQVQKITVFTYRSPHFCFPWRRPCDYHAICCMDGKSIRCLPNPSQHVPIYLQYFPSYTMLKSTRKSKNRYFYHIFDVFTSAADATNSKKDIVMEEISCQDISNHAHR